MFHAHDGFAFFNGFLDQFQEAQGQVIKGHVANVRTRITEGDQGVFVLHQFADNFALVVTHCGVPAQLATKLHYQIEEQIDHMHFAGAGHFIKVFAHQIRVWAFKNNGIPEITLPHARA